MTTEPAPNPNAVRLERTYNAPVELLWELLTTADRPRRVVGADGFETRVHEVELRPGGHVRYTMTATSKSRRRPASRTCH
jgi:uncharacterized protein YndB with AHSA1/START domain